MRLRAGFLTVILLGAHPALADDHARLVQRGRAESEVLWRRGFTLDEATADSLLQRMLDTLTVGVPRPPGVELRIHVFRSPEINAFALPDGSIYVFAGLISEFQTLDQLAFVLRHEAQHALGMHALKNIKQAKEKTAALQVLSLAGSVLIGSAVLNAFTQLGLGLAAAYSVSGYGRDLEREADLAASRLLAGSGMDSCAAAESFEIMLRHSEQPGKVANFFWGNHPMLKTRIQYVREASGGPACEFDSSRMGRDYAPIKWPMMKLSAALWTAAGERHKALRSAEAYRSAFPEAPESYALLGDVLSLSSAPDTLRLAGDAYRRALTLAPSDDKPALRGLALVSERQRDTTACIGYLERYLAGNGSALRDRRSLQRKLETLKATRPNATGSPVDTTTVEPGESTVIQEKED